MPLPAASELSECLFIATALGCTSCPAHGTVDKDCVTKERTVTGHTRVLNSILGAERGTEPRRGGSQSCVCRDSWLTPQHTHSGMTCQRSGVSQGQTEVKGGIARAPHAPPHVWRSRDGVG